MPALQVASMADGAEVQEIEMTQTPILFLGDSPDLHGGLSRITRDLATFCSTLPQFRVGCLGRGGTGNRNLGFMQYHYPDIHQWGEAYIQQVWRDFAGDQDGIVFSIWDASRVTWLAQPEYLPEGSLRDFLLQRPFRLWGYFPIDASGPGDRLTTMSANTIARYDRAIAYGQWAAKLIERSTGRAAEWAPHGISDKWQPRDPLSAKMSLGFTDDVTVIGCVMSNQSRKDWACAIAAISLLCERNPKIRGWAHIDAAERSHAWNLNALMADFGMEKKIRVTLSGSLTDEQMSWLYSACAVTFVPSAEGFGYPVIESMACGVPCVHSTYAGGAELVPAEWRVAPVAYRLEGLHNSLRPVFEPSIWADVIQAVMEVGDQREFCLAQVEHLRWKNLWPGVWQKLMLEGMK